MTFMPYVRYQDSVRNLHEDDLHQQVTDCMTIFRTLLGDRRKVSQSNNHSVRMWINHELALLSYGAAAAHAWRDSQGMNEYPLQSWFFEMSAQYGLRFPRNSIKIPPWVGDLNFHRSHRSNLIRIRPGFYNSWGEVPENMPYLWPRGHREGSYSLYVSNGDRAKLVSGERVLPDWLELCDDGEVIQTEEDDE